MAVPSDLLNILVCPIDKSKVELLADESGLKCSQCGHVYPIIEDIPVMIPDYDSPEQKEDERSIDEHDAKNPPSA
jgi:uncharacterized protein YbaR (Trm112 family)